MFDHTAAVRLTYKAERICKHARASEEALNYWPDKYMYAYSQDGDAGVEYMYQRNLGLNAGPADTPPFGPYGHDKDTPPPSPYPEESDGSIPPPDPIPPSELTAIAADVKHIAELLDKVAKRFGF